MRTIFLFAIVSLSLFACTPATMQNEEEEIPLAETDIRFEFMTTEADYDEINLVYYDHKIDAFRDSVMVFDYDNANNPLPIILEWENHGFQYLRGEVYRNNFSPAELTARILVNDTEVFIETKTGNANQFARIFWDYTIY